MPECSQPPWNDRHSFYSYKEQMSFQPAEVAVTRQSATVQAAFESCFISKAALAFQGVFPGTRPVSTTRGQEAVGLVACTAQQQPLCVSGLSSRLRPGGSRFTSPIGHRDQLGDLEPATLSASLTSQSCCRDKNGGEEEEVICFGSPLGRKQ